MGPWGGFVTGLAETLEYVLTTAAVVYFSTGYADSIFHDLFGVNLPIWVWWIILYAVFVLLNAAGSAISFRFAIVVAIISLAVLVVFAVTAVFSGAINFASLFDIKPDAGGTTSCSRRRRSTRSAAVSTETRRPKDMTRWRMRSSPISRSRVAKRLRIPRPEPFRLGVSPAAFVGPIAYWKNYQPALEG